MCECVYHKDVHAEMQRRCSGHSASATTHFGFHVLYIVCATVLTAKNDFGSQ